MPDDDVLARAKAELPADARMDAYYYSFNRTGLEIVDAILSQVAIAGKHYHHTESWGDPWDVDAVTEQDAIQAVANESATAIRELIALAETQARQLADVRTAISSSSGMSDISVFIRILAILDGNQQ